MIQIIDKSQNEDEFMISFFKKDNIIYVFISTIVIEKLSGKYTGVRNVRTSEYHWTGLNSSKSSLCPF